MGFWDFCNANPWFPALAVLVAGVVAYGVSDDIRTASQRRARHRSIVARGWPPVTCDGDGNPISPSDRGYVPARDYPARAEEEDES